jgi:hypothetical protein
VSPVHPVPLTSVKFVQFNISLSSFFVFCFAWPFYFIPGIYNCSLNKLISPIDCGVIQSPESQNNGLMGPCSYNVVNNPIWFVGILSMILVLAVIHMMRWLNAFFIQSDMIYKYIACSLHVFCTLGQQAERCKRPYLTAEWFAHFGGKSNPVPFREESIFVLISSLRTCTALKQGWCNHPFAGWSPIWWHLWSSNAIPGA